MDEQRVWHGLKPLIDACITVVCRARVVRDPIPSSVMTKRIHTAPARRDKHELIPDKKASEIEPVTSWFLCSPGLRGRDAVA